MSFDLLQATFLALIQGITEFLPISSSAHLILPAALLDWQDQGLAFDVAVHLGSLVAVILYFRQDLLRLVQGFFNSLVQKRQTADGRLAWMLLVATMPVIVAGFLGQELVESRLRSVSVIAFTTIAFGLLLWLADRRSEGSVGLQGMTWRTCLVIGAAQVLALIPGTSRSGITMTAALFCNLSRDAASRFSFLLSIPVISGAALLLTLDLIESGSVNWPVLSYAMFLTAVVAYLCIHLFLKTITAMGFLPFVVYRIGLGLLLWAFFVPAG